MKLTTILLISLSLCANAKTIAQTITMSERNVSLEKVFKEIHRKTGYQFFYKDELIKQAKKVSIDVKDASVEEVLEICFRDQPLTFSIKQKAITVTKKDDAKTGKGSASPPIVVTGKVTDYNNVGLPGVSVSVIGSPTGVFTDMDGNFTITVPDNSVLSFTFVGFKTENVRVGKESTTVNISLTQQAASLTDVVVVGYGTQKKISVVGAVTAIGTNELRQSPTTNLSNALAGRMPGLMVNQFLGGEPGVDQSDVFIRGLGTYNSGNSQKPIVIVDGIERDYQYLNPEEIETFSILKDASATAVFGVRGANGVILVTTRRGKLMDRSHVTFKAASGISAPVKFPEYLGSADYALLYNEAQDNDKSPRTRFTSEAIENYRRAKGDNSDGLGYNIDLFDYAFKPSLQQDYNMNIQGGNKNVKYFMMAGYMNQDGNYKHTKLSNNNTNAVFKRYNFRSNIDINITDNFYARLNLGGRIQNRIAPGTTAARVVNIANTQPSIYPIILENNDNPANKSYISKHPEGLLFGTQLYRYNILGEIAYSGFINEYKTFMDGSFALGHKLDFVTKGLNFEVQYSYDVQGGNTVNRTIPHESEGYREYGGYATFYPKDGVDIFMNMNGTHYQGAYVTPRRSDNATMNNGYDPNTPFAQRKNHLQMTLNYARSFGAHSVSAMLLGLQQRRTVSTDVPFSNQGLAFRATYNFSDRYLFEVNAGYNGSESFPKGARFGFFPAAAAGWVISNESFMKKSSTIDYLKIRGSYGLVGSDQLPGIRFGYLQFFEVNGDNYNFGISQSNGAPANVYESPLANLNLTWEKAKKANLGVEVRVLSNRLSFTADVFKEHRFDILTAIPNSYGTRNVSAVVGQNAPQLNIGVVDNKGVDLEIGWTDNIGKSFSYYIRPNFSFARNKIMFVNEIDRIAPDGKTVSYAQRTGKRIGEQFVYVFDHFVADQAEADRLNAANYQKWGGLIPGDVVYKDQNGDGQITDQEDRVAMGNPRNPEIQFGIPFGASYKSFDVSVLFQGATNTSVQLVDAAAWDFPTYGQDIIGRVKKFHLARWTSATAGTATYPALHYGTHLNNKNPNSSLFLADASYVRLKSLEVGYSISPKFLKRFGFTKTRFYLQGLNLATWDKLSTFDVDPETNTGGDWYPIQKVYNLGVYVTF